MITPNVTKRTITEIAIAINMSAHKKNQEKLRVYLEKNAKLEYDKKKSTGVRRGASTR